MKAKDDLPVGKLGWLAIDIESTGFLDKPLARIIEIGVRSEAGQKKSWLLRHPGLVVPPEITKFNGIDTDLLETKGQDPKTVFEELGKWLDGAFFLLGHNIVGFDLPFLVRECSKLGLGELGKRLTNLPIFDTGLMFKASQLGPPFTDFAREGDWESIHRHRARGVKWKLSYCCETFGIPFSEEAGHRAGYDVERTVLVYKRLKSNLDKVGTRK